MSLERMDKIFGEVDAVEVGEQQCGTEKAEIMKMSATEHREFHGVKDIGAKDPGRTV